MQNKYRIFFAAALLALLTACTHIPLPVYNVINAPVVAKRAVTADEVKSAILLAAPRYNWQMVATKPGLITATYMARTHTGIVEIPYDAKSYSLKYKDSSNLKYDGANIHPFYNSWIQNLDKEIRFQLAAI